MSKIQSQELEADRLPDDFSKWRDPPDARIVAIVEEHCPSLDVTAKTALVLALDDYLETEREWIRDAYRYDD